MDSPLLPVLCFWLIFSLPLRSLDYNLDNFNMVMGPYNPQLAPLFCEKSQNTVSNMCCLSLQAVHSFVFLCVRDVGTERVKCHPVSRALLPKKRLMQPCVNSRSRDVLRNPYKGNRQDSSYKDWGRVTKHRPRDGLPGLLKCSWASHDSQHWAGTQKL